MTISLVGIGCSLPVDDYGAPSGDAAWDTASSSGDSAAAPESFGADSFGADSFGTDSFATDSLGGDSRGDIGADTGSVTDTGMPPLVCTGTLKACGTPPMCVDVKRDPNNCGDCGHICDPSLKCRTGVCA